VTDQDRLLRILTVLRGTTREALGPARLCEACAEVVAVSGAGVMLMSEGIPQGSLCSSNEVSTLIEDLQYTLGEGPCVDAYELDHPVLEPNLAAAGPSRWPAFAPPAVEAGARAMFGFPLQVGAIRLGAMNLYRATAGALHDEQHRDALLMAGVVARAVLAMQAGAPPGRLGEDLQMGLDLRLVVHQAAGMVSAQLEISIVDAMIRLRAHAYASARTVAAVADDVVARRLRFE
jgi:hypothetical protein